MNTLHKDINKIIPFGEFLRGFINQRYITVSDLSRVLRQVGSDYQRLAYITNDY